MELKDHAHELTTAPREEVVTHNEIVKFDSSRMIGIIKRKALIKELAAAYHAECIACGQELLQLQKKFEERLRPSKFVTKAQYKEAACRKKSSRGDKKSA